MSAGIADAGMRMLGKDRPTPLPVQALDHATGYLMAAVVVRGLTQRMAAGQGFEGRTSLARPHNFWSAVTIGEASMRWDRPAATLGSSAPTW
jgi:hypothetical protein